jgi:hypothetical protein
MNLTPVTLCSLVSFWSFLVLRRASEEDTIPAVGIEKEVKLLRGSDLFIAVYNLHRSPK